MLHSLHNLQLVCDYETVDNILSRNVRIPAGIELNATFLPSPAAFLDHIRKFETIFLVLLATNLTIPAGVEPNAIFHLMTPSNI